MQQATVAQLKARDWKPFQAAIAAGAPMVMTGHIAVPALEPGVPASLSKATYAALRGMGFKGVAVTDALNMGAVSRPVSGTAPRRRQHWRPGADLLLMPADVDAAHAAIVGCRRNRKASAGTPGRGGAPGGHHDDLAGPHQAGTSCCGSGQRRRRLGQSLRPGRHRSHRAVQGSARRGPRPGGRRHCGGQGPLRRCRQGPGIALGAGPLVTLIGYGGAPAGGDIAVALDAPWPLARSAAPTKIALYGRTPGAYKALLAVLAGKAPAPGKLPAAVGTYRAGTGCR